MTGRAAPDRGEGARTPGDGAAALAAAWWPLDRLGDGLQALARHAGWAAASTAPLPAPPVDIGADIVRATRWLTWSAERLGLELETVDAAVAELDRLVRGAGPALVPWEDAQRGMGFVLLVGSRHGRASLLGPDLRLQRWGREELAQALAAPHEAPLRPGIDALMARAALAPSRQPAVRAALLREQLSGVRVPAWWMLRLPASAAAWPQLLQARLPQTLLALLVVSGLLYGAEAAAWALIGQGVLDGRVDTGWLGAWVLLLLVMLPLQLAGQWLDGRFARTAAGLLKERLLAGALRLDVDAVRRSGMGEVLGRVIESQALESLLIGGGLATAVAVIEGMVAAGVLALGACAAPHLLLLGLWLLLTIGLSTRLARRLADWTRTRLALTHTLIEQMVGHRTRLAQERPARRDAAEDAAAGDYLQRSQAYDGATWPLQVLLPAGWMMASLGVLASAFVAGAPGGAAPAAATTAMAISLGGILLAQRALAGITGGLASLARAGVAWTQVAALFHAGRRPDDERATAFADASTAASAGPSTDRSTELSTDPSTDPSAPAAPDAPAGPRRLLQARDLRFAHASGAPVLAGVNLEIRAGDRLLLQGPSGGGKSTLAAVLAGLRRPASGLLLAQGLDPATLGRQWQSWASLAPQFHENHVFTASLAFNLLMGRQWPADEPALQEAQAVCEELGLGELIARMPAGLHQRIGETGWQLSHGERSRLFLARALLQGAPLTLLDECLAALDPETLAQCLACVQRRAATLLVIAHP